MNPFNIVLTGTEKQHTVFQRMRVEDVFKSIGSARHPSLATAQLEHEYLRKAIFIDVPSHSLLMFGTKGC